MKLDASSNLLIRRYLLSSVSEEEREQVETRLMTDDDFFEQINLVEDELVEQYLDHELSAPDRARFEDTFLCAPERQHKLRFTKALRFHAANAAKQKTLQLERAIHPWYEPFFGLFKISHPGLAYSFSLAFVLLLVAASSSLIIQMHGFKAQISGLQAQQQQRETELSRLRDLSEKEHARADQLASLFQEQEKRDPAQSWFTVTAGAQRSAQFSKPLEIPKGAILVNLSLDLAKNWKETYRAVLSSGGGKEILTRDNLKAAVSDKEIIIMFSVPATDLPSGHYIITLYGTGEKEAVDTYSFGIARN
jgi:hypothetical protein